MRIAAEEAAKRQALEEARIRAELEAKIRAEEPFLLFLNLLKMVRPNPDI